jgi:anti-anti-sigma factor
VLVPLKLSFVSEEAGVVHLAAEGDVTAVDLHAAAVSPFQVILGQTWNTRRILLNMENVSYLDSCGIGWLISTQKAFRAAGGYLAMHSLQPQVRHLLNLLKLDRVVPMADGAAAGREALAKSAPAVATAR